MVTVIRERHIKNAYSPMLVTLLGIVIFSRLEQTENALFPIFFTPLGIVTLFSLLRKNALSAMLTTPLGTVYESSAFAAGYKISSVLSLLNTTPFSEEKTLLPADTFMFSMLLPTIAPASGFSSTISVTPLGIVMLLSLSQPKNALKSIFVKLSGSVMLSRLSQTPNALYPMLETPSETIISFRL